MSDNETDPQPSATQPTREEQGDRKFQLQIRENVEFICFLFQINLRVFCEFAVVDLHGCINWQYSKITKTTNLLYL